MNLPIFASAAAFLFSTAATAQHSPFNDDGSLAIDNKTSGYVHNQAAGSLSTDFNSNNQFAGNMIDIAPVVDMEITGIDMNILSVGNVAEVDVWYIPGTSIGFEGSSAGWTLLGTFSGTTAGQDLPSYFDMSGNGMTFTGGQTYGLYFDCITYGNGDTVRYTNGSGVGTGANGEDEWSNADLTITASAGKGSGGHAGSTFKPRNWNGTIYYDTGSGGGFTLTVGALQSGGNASVDTSGSVPGTTVIVGFSLTGGGQTQTNVGLADLSAPIYRRPPQISDASGNTTASYFIPAGASGQDIWLQAVNVTSHGVGVFSNQVASTIL